MEQMLQDLHAAGFAVVTETEVFLKRPLPKKKDSVQAVELVALTEACKLKNKKVVNIYNDSQYAFSTVHVFAQQWKNRGMVTSRQIYKS